MENSISYETSQKTFYPFTDELKAKAKSFGWNRRKRYITKKNNPFSMKEGITFTGTGIERAISKTVVNFLKMNTTKKGEIDGVLFDTLHPYIRTVVMAICKDTIVSAVGMTKKGEIFETGADVDYTKTGLLYSEFFYDEETKQIYRYE